MNEVHSKINDIKEIHPIPNILVLPEENIHNVMINFITKETRNEIEKTNSYLLKIKENLVDKDMISILWIYLSILISQDYFSLYEKIVRLKIERSIKMYGSKIKQNKMEEMIQDESKNIREMCEIKQKEHYEFNKKLEEIREKIKNIDI